MQRRPTLTALTVAGALVLAACGGTDATTATPGAGTDAATGELPSPAAGPVPELEVSTASEAASPLPAVAVRQLNGEGGWVQFKNELPAEQPLLVWFWAPF